MSFYIYKGKAPETKFDTIYVGQPHRGGLLETLKQTKDGGKWIFRNEGKYASFMAYFEADLEFKKLWQSKKITAVVDADFDLKPKKKRERKTRTRKRVDEPTVEDRGRADMDDLVQEDVPGSGLSDQ